MPRRKKYPELAYRSHEVLRMSNGTGESSDSLDTETGFINSRARSELRNQDRGSAGPRSKSVDPYLGRRRPFSAVVQSGGAGIPSSQQQLPPEHRFLHLRGRLDPYKPPDHLMTQSYPPAATHAELPPPIYANGPESESIHHPETAVTAATPRKSISMGAILVAKPADHVDSKLTVEEEIFLAERVPDRQTATPGHHDGATAGEEPVEKRKLKSADSSEILQVRIYDEAAEGETWVEEVAELRRKADEYKCRSVVGNFPLPSSRQEMIDQVSKRSNLSALALATTPRDKAKEEQNVKAKKSLLNEQTRAKRERAKTAKAKTTTTTSSTTTTKHIPSHHPHSYVGLKQEKRIAIGESIVDGQPVSARSHQPLVRHHLERTTPTAGETGVLITSPTRDHKLEPVQLQRSRSAKKESKTKTSQRPSSKTADDHSTRASSVTPTSAVGRTSITATHKSPKRAARPMSMIVPGTKSVVNGTWNGSSAQDSTGKVETKQTRPTTLATTSTTKPRSAPIKAAIETTAKVHSTVQPKAKPAIAAKERLPAQLESTSSSFLNGSEEKGVTKEQIDEAFRSISKPTRVKSPEQIIVKSPETVNWTIPLETRIKWTSGPTKIEDDSERLTPSERIRSPPMIMSPVQQPSPQTASTQPSDVDPLDIINRNGVSSPESMSSSQDYIN
ncbi:hypothetical protein CHUAL_005102 [Chamberlinius hualienensis]